MDRRSNPKSSGATVNVSTLGMSWELAEQVAAFWHSFHSFRDLAMVGLMLLDGLRSCEVLSLQLEDLQLADAQMRVIGS